MKKNILTTSSLIAFCISLGAFSTASSQALRQTKGKFYDAFRQLDPEELPTPNDYRSANGGPGYKYWQQKVDYKIDVALDEGKKLLNGSEAIKYKNNSPDEMRYLWLLLDQNIYKRDSISEMTRTAGEGEKISFDEARRMVKMRDWEGGFDILSITTKDGKPLQYNIVDTLLRVELPNGLKTGEEFEFILKWKNEFADAKLVGGRSGYECFDKKNQDGNCIFEAAQWFPRLAAYSDYEGWHNKAFVGSGEFTLEFGDYEVNVTVPSDFVIASTGELKNPDKVLSAEQVVRMQNARKNYDKPVFITTPTEALKAQTNKEKSQKTWKFSAQNVRDFAWAGSRKFIWDAMAVKQKDGAEVMAMSFYPNEAEPLWSHYSTQSIAHTLRTYSKMSFPYPYPVAQSVNGPVGGMEYPMITFNGPRPEKDDKGNLTYSERTKYGLISVIIHEIGHIYFPMTVNSDERQWTWMDEGLNTFLQYVSEQEWSNNYPSRRGDPRDIAEYMLSTSQVPIMTNSESILQFGNNAYGKPATALVILRESILGREVFDRAFREYSQSWKFKRPTPADFFRSMEESSGVDLDWFWRGWFYSTDHVDIAINSVTEGTIDTQDAQIESKRKINLRNEQPVELGVANNANLKKLVDSHPELRDYYDKNDPMAATKSEIKKAKEGVAKLEKDDSEMLSLKEKFYNVKIENKGGLVMPVILKFTFADNTSDIVRIPAEIWRRSPDAVNWMYMSKKDVTQVEVDPLQETADANRNNNYYPQKMLPSRLQLYREKAIIRNQMKDDELSVTPQSLQTQPAKN
jgi:Peptidase family M1 domain